MREEGEITVYKKGPSNLLVVGPKSMVFSVLSFVVKVEFPKSNI